MRKILNQKILNEPTADDDPSYIDVYEYECVVELTIPTSTTDLIITSAPQPVTVTILPCEPIDHDIFDGTYADQKYLIYDSEQTDPLVISLDLFD